MKFKGIWLIVVILLALTLAVESCEDCFVTQLCGPYRWTKWINRDRPSLNGDWELVSESIIFGGCKDPIFVECQTVSGIPWWQTGEVINYSTKSGCICINADQPDKKCNYDYRIRELCPI